jgi:hypothetical protein
MSFYDHVLRLDQRETVVVRGAVDEERARRFTNGATELAARLERGVGEPPRSPNRADGAAPRPGRPRAAVGTAKQRITAGDLFQATSTLR